MYLFGFSVFIGPIARNWLFAINLCSHKCRQHSLQALSIDPSFLAAQLAIKLLEIVKNVFGGWWWQCPKSQSKIQPTHFYLSICISTFVSPCGSGQPELRSKIHIAPSTLISIFGVVVRVHLAVDSFAYFNCPKMRGNFVKSLQQDLNINFASSL